jgi:hypothetical protein
MLSARYPEQVGWVNHVEAKRHTCNLRTPFPCRLSRLPPRQPSSLLLRVINSLLLISRFLFLEDIAHLPPQTLVATRRISHDQYVIVLFLVQGPGDSLRDILLRRTLPTPDVAAADTEVVVSHRRLVVRTDEAALRGLVCPVWEEVAIGEGKLPHWADGDRHF